jgi:hypothetical protein
MATMIGITANAAQRALFDFSGSGSLVTFTVYDWVAQEFSAVQYCTLKFWSPLESWPGTNETDPSWFWTTIPFSGLTRTTTVVTFSIGGGIVTGPPVDFTTIILEGAGDGLRIVLGASGGAETGENAASTVGTGAVGTGIIVDIAGIPRQERAS